MSLGIAGECENGAAGMAYARAVFEQLGKPVRFAQALVALEATYKQLDDWHASIPFGSRCYELERVGDQARELADQMLREAGLATAPKPRGVLEELRSLVWGVAIAAGIYYGAQALSRREGR